MRAGTSDRRSDGFIRRFLRGLLQLPAPQRAGADWSARMIPVEARISVSRFRDAQIDMAHGAGGKASRRLVEGLFAPLLMGAANEPLGDAALLSVNGASLAITTECFVVKPLRFPGG